MEDRQHINQDYHRAQRKGTLDARDPVEIAGNDAKYAELEHANRPRAYDEGQDTGNIARSGSLREGLKRRIGSLRHRKNDD